MKTTTICHGVTSQRVALSGLNLKKICGAGARERGKARVVCRAIVQGRVDDTVAGERADRSDGRRP